MKGNFELSKGSRRSIPSGAGRATGRFPISPAKKKASDYENHFLCRFMWLLLAATYYYKNTGAAQNHAFERNRACRVCCVLRGCMLMAASVGVAFTC